MNGKRKAILLHQSDGISANIRWIPNLSEVEQRNLIESMIAIRALEYWASEFPERDGITFHHENYEVGTAVDDVSKCFSWLTLIEIPFGGSVTKALQMLNEGEMITIRYLVPAEKVLIDQCFSLGPYKFHKPVVPDDYPALEHPWVDELLDVPGADVNVSWNPGSAPHGSLARLLGFTLIEGSIKVSGNLLYPSNLQPIEWEKLALYVTEHADRALDILRHRYCDYERLHFTPHHAGVIEDSSFRLAYLMPTRSDIKPHMIAAKPQVFEALNVWLGLQVDPNFSSYDERLGNIVSGNVDNELEGRLRASMRAKGQTFLLVSDEMRFVSLIFAADSISCVGEKRGLAHRKHLAAAANTKNLYLELLDDIRLLYPIRNKIVHDGMTFRELGLDSTFYLTKIDRILSTYIDLVLRSNLRTAKDLQGMINERIQDYS